ncbi:hypothetical protein FB451DRAFT_736672 [Mycena latifolia]|nr:hypothetical protein FB451DRAFT_736672 [Mycena latifolia]
MALTYFSCDGCECSIPATDPRVHCLDCADYDLCANCAVGERFTGTHGAGHQTRVFKMSGGGKQGMVASAVAIVYAGIQAADVETEAPNSSSLPTATLEAQNPSISGAPLAAEPPAPAPEPLPAPTPVAFSRHISSLPAFNPPTPPAPYPASPAPNFGSQQPLSNPSPRPAATMSPPPQMGAAPGSSFPAHGPGMISPPPASRAEITPPPPPPPVPEKRISMPPPPPLPARQRPASTVYSLPAVGVSSHTMPPRDGEYAPPQESSYAMPPRNDGYTPAPRPTPQETAPSATGWGPFFLADLSPTPVFTTLMRALFAHLDPRRTGVLTPEAYSHFLIDQGYVGQDNTWNANLIAGVGQTKEEVADAALRRVFDLFSIEYSLTKRARAPNAPVDALTRTLQAFGASIGTNAVPPPASGGLMPLLTFAGFMEVTSIEILCDPSAHWGNLSRVLRLYDLPALRAWGPLPRSVLPEQADPRMVARVEKVAAFSKAQGERELAAAYAKSKLQAMGRQNALDLLDDRRYRYT